MEQRTCEPAGGRYRGPQLPSENICGARGCPQVCSWGWPLPLASTCVQFAAPAGQAPRASRLGPPGSCRLREQMAYEWHTEDEGGLPAPKCVKARNTGDRSRSVFAMPDQREGASRGTARSILPGTATGGLGSARCKLLAWPWDLPSLCFQLSRQGGGSGVAVGLRSLLPVGLHTQGGTGFPGAAPHPGPRELGGS